jgi:hypothetical protein
MGKSSHLTWPFIVIILGIIAWVIARMMKIMHWLNADMAVIIATIILVCGLLFLIARLLWNKNK